MYIFGAVAMIANDINLHFCKFLVCISPKNRIFATFYLVYVPLTTDNIHDKTTTKQNILTMDSIKILQDTVKARHSVRQYTDQSIANKVVTALQDRIKAINAESGLHLQLVVNEPQAFDSFMAHYGKFSGVSNYLALIGSGDRLDERCGYYGEQVVLLAQQLGLNSCWVGMTFKKVVSALDIRRGEKLTAVVALGYGQTQGVSHKVKTISEVSSCSGAMPDWFRQGVECALLAPTAMNQQKFRFELLGDKVRATASWAPFSKMDLGIVKYHFELGAGVGPAVWA